METDARLIAIRYYSQSARNLQEDLHTLGNNPEAIIIYLPQLVVLMKPVHSQCPQQWDKLHDTPAGADAWYVHLLAGDLSLARRLAAQQKPRRWLCFQRGARHARPHIIRWERFAAPQHPHKPKA